MVSRLLVPVFFVSVLFSCSQVHGQSCPEGWFQLFASCYKIQLNESTFLEAVNDCIQSHGYLLHDETDEEYKLLLYTFEDAYDDKTFWITSEETPENVTCHYVENMEQKNGSCHEERSSICKSHHHAEENCSTFSSRRFLDGCYFLGGPNHRYASELLCESNVRGTLVNVSTQLQASFAKAAAVCSNLTLWVGNTQQERSQCMRASSKGEFLLSSIACNETAHPFCEIPHHVFASGSTASNAATTSTAETATTVSTVSTATTVSTTTAATTTFNIPKPLTCPISYHWKSRPNSQYCYLESSYVMNRMTWDEARNFCRSFGGDLASYTDSIEESFALGSAIGDGDIWIGLRRSETEGGPFSWSDGTTVNYTHWAENEPSGRNDKNCVTHSGPESMWKMSRCGAMYWFMCKAPKGHYSVRPEETMPSLENERCGGGSEYLAWYRFGEHCYAIKLVNDKSFYTAQYYCADHGANLTSIHSPKENTFILSIIRGKPEGNLWTGLSSRGLQSSFTWTDGTPLEFVNWDNEHHENDSMILNKCVAFDKYSGLWTIEHCNTFFSVICKRGINGTTATLNTTAEPELPGFCPDEWYTLDNYCYMPFGLKATAKLSWVDANDKCSELGAQLVSIHSEKEQGFLTSLVVDVGHSTWTGLYAEDRGVLYHWTDNSSLDFTQWDDGEPYNEGRPENCVELVYDQNSMAKWNDVTCGKPKAFICKKLKDPALTRPGLDPSRCMKPKGWLKLGHSCLSEVLKTPLTWLEAQSRCRKLGGNLPTIRSFGTTLFLKSFLPSQNETLVWLGLRENGVHKSDTYAWLSGYPMTYSHWLEGQPMRVSDHDNCVAINSEGYWMVRDCRENLNFFCEFNSEGYYPAANNRPSACPDSNTTSWIDLHVGSNCFHVVQDHHSFFEAMRICFVKGGTLASFHSPEELDALAPYVKSMDKPVHIGLAQREDGTFGWLDGSAVDYVHWEEGEPNSPDEACVEMDTNVLTWNDIKCSIERGFICSTRKIPVSLDMIASTTNDPITGKVPSAKHVQDRLAVGGVVSIIICLIIVIIVISVISYYLCPRSRHRGRQKLRRLSDQDVL